MTDMRADEPGEEDRLPWLEAVEEEDGEGGPSPLKLIAAVVIGLITIGLVVGGLFWLGNREGSGTGDAEVIAAPEGDYKVAPEDRGGMTVEGEGDTSFAASAGADPRGRINVDGVAETPVTKAQQPSRPAPAAPQPTASPQPAQPAQAAAPAGSIQLGAFSSQAAASGAWRALSGRFAYLAPLTHSVSPVQAGGRTLYRLRASGPGASGVCGRLRVAGETCVAVD